MQYLTDNKLVIQIVFRVLVVEQNVQAKENQHFMDYSKNVPIGVQNEKHRFPDL